MDLERPPFGIDPTAALARGYVAYLQREIHVPPSPEEREEHRLLEHHGYRRGRGDGSVATSRPPMRTAPDSIVSSPAIARSRLVLPEPDGRKAITSYPDIFHNHSPRIRGFGRSWRGVNTGPNRARRTRDHGNASTDSERHSRGWKPAVCSSSGQIVADLEEKFFTAPSPGIRSVVASHDGSRVTGANIDTSDTETGNGSPRPPFTWFRQ